MLPKMLTLSSSYVPRGRSKPIPGTRIVWQIRFFDGERTFDNPPFFEPLLLPAFNPESEC